VVRVPGVIFDGIMNRAPVPPVRLNPDVPAGLERMINRRKASILLTCASICIGLPSCRTMGQGWRRRWLGRRAREFSRQAVASAKQAQQKETAARYEAATAVREALFGNAAEARQRGASAVGLSTSRDVQYGVSLALSFIEDASREQARIEKLADNLAKRFPEDTVVQFNYLPTLRAELAISRNDASKAIDALQTAAPYELGLPSYGGFSDALYPVCVRGQAYVAAHQGGEAVVEFQKILDHRSVVVNEPMGVLAHLGLVDHGIQALRPKFPGRSAPLGE